MGIFSIYIFQCWKIINKTTSFTFSMQIVTTKQFQDNMTLYVLYLGSRRSWLFKMVCCFHSSIVSEVMNCL